MLLELAQSHFRRRAAGTTFGVDGVLGGFRNRVSSRLVDDSDVEARRCGGIIVRRIDRGRYRQAAVGIYTRPRSAHILRTLYHSIGMLTNHRAVWRMNPPQDRG